MTNPNFHNTGRTHFKKDRIPWNKGLIWVEKSKCKYCKKELYDRRAVACRQCFNKNTPPAKGHHQGLENNKKRSERMKGKMPKNIIYLQNLKSPTSIEKIVYNFLKSKGIIFEKQKFIEGKFIVDVYIPDFNLIIECDGNYWHSLDKVIKRDKAKNAYLSACGYNLLRLSETEINNGSFK